LISQLCYHTSDRSDCQVGNAGFEPATSALSAHCSTAELISHMGLVGLEPTTSRLKARYSTIELQTLAEDVGFEPTEGLTPSTV
jgi:hypothetical protein